jgi:ubiquinone/menaquinone biosynthesis C-methylase UbiE
MTEKRFHASQAHRLDAPERFMWLPPAEVIAALAIQPGDTIADIGAGTGYFASPMADAAGPLGKVYAVDAQAEMLEHLRAKLETNRTANVELVHAEADATGLPGATCNLLLLANVWHEFDDHAAVLRESKRVLAPGGRIAILDWRPDVERDAGPPLDHRIPAAHCMQDLLTAGFVNTAHTNTGKYSWLVQGELPR